MKLDFEQRQRSGKLADEMAAADELGNYADVIIYLRDEIAKLQAQPSLESAAREIARVDFVGGNPTYERYVLKIGNFLVTSGDYAHCCDSKAKLLSELERHLHSAAQPEEK